MMRLLLLLLFCCVVAGPASAAFDPFQAAGIDRKDGAGMPLTTEFLDSEGQAVTLQSIARGRPILLVPVLHNCPNICGVTLSGLMQAISLQDWQPGRDFIIVAFGIDPGEGPPDARRALEQLRARYPDMPPSAIRALAGPADRIGPAMNSLGYRYAFDERIGQYAHISATAVLTAEGKVARWLYGLQPQPGDLRLALIEAGRGQIGNWTDQLLLLCYHYDPVTGQYGSLVQTMLRASAAMLVLVGAGLMARSWWRERKGRDGENG